MVAESQVRLLREDEYDRWTQFVLSCPSGSIFALPAYLEDLCGATGGYFTITGVFHGEELVGGLPLYYSQSRLGFVSKPRALLSYQSPVIRAYVSKAPAERTARQAAILAHLARYLRTAPCVHMVLMFNNSITDIRPFLSAGWHAYPDYTYLADIGDLPRAWRRVSQNLRRLIRRATDAGLECTDDDDYDSLFRLHFAVHMRKQSPLYLPEAPFKQFVARLRAQGFCRLYHARLPDGKAVAAQLVLTGQQPVSHTVCAGSDVEYLATGASPFLRWKSFEALAALGYTTNDLTGAPYGSEVTRFKSQLGGELVANWQLTRPLTRRYQLRRKAQPLVKFIRRWFRKQ